MGHGPSLVNYTGSHRARIIVHSLCCAWKKVQKLWNRQTHLMTSLVSMTFDWPRGGRETEKRQKLQEGVETDVCLL